MPRDESELPDVTNKTTSKSLSKILEYKKKIEEEYQKICYASYGEEVHTSYSFLTNSSDFAEVWKKIKKSKNEEDIIKFLKNVTGKDYEDTESRCFESVVIDKNEKFVEMLRQKGFNVKTETLKYITVTDRHRDPNELMSDDIDLSDSLILISELNGSFVCSTHSDELHEDIDVYTLDVYTITYNGSCDDDGIYKDLKPLGFYGFESDEE